MISNTVSCLAFFNQKDQEKPSFQEEKPPNAKHDHRFDSCVLCNRRDQSKTLSVGSPRNKENCFSPPDRGPISGGLKVFLVLKGPVEELLVSPF